jgi:hypothetical protein
MRPASQVSAFLARYDPAIASVARAALKGLRAQLPGATEFVYDNYNALVFGFGPTDRASDAVVSIAVYPRWINLFFLNGAALPDPQALLSGSGSRVRRILVRDAATLEDPAVKALIARAAAAAKTPFDRAAGRRQIVKSISPTRRPRLPAAKKASPSKP